MNNKKAKKLRKLVYQNQKIDTLLKKVAEETDTKIDAKYERDQKRKTYKEFKKIYGKVVRNESK